MPQKIKIKRGNKANLPKLALGEPAFSLDSKELFIGNYSYNQQPQTKNNLLVNGNFQVVSENFEAVTNKIVITPGTSRYIFGNFYISNSNLSIGNITISRPENGFIKIECTNAQMNLEYKEKLAEYLTMPGLTVSYIRPLLNQNLTFSCDYKNSGNSLNFSSGNPLGILNKLVIPSGSGNASNTFPMRYSNVGAINYSRIILFSNSTASTYTFSIGNLKLEQGNYRTQFVPNSMYEDILAIEQVYKTQDIAIRCLNGNIGDSFTFYYPILIPTCFKNSSAIVKVNTSDIYSFDGVKQTGFIVVSSYVAENNSIVLQARKTNNQLKETYIIANVSVDLRPY